MKKSNTKKIRPVIGRVEKVDFPDLDLYDIDCKTDTGAYTSSIHCHDITTYRLDETGEEVVRFFLLDPSHPSFNHREFVLPVKTRRKVKNSFGESQKRIIIQTKMMLFSKVYVVELSLADRSRMNYPVLLGRKAINKRFLVDVSQKNLSHKLKISAKPL